MYTPVFEAYTEHMNDEGKGDRWSYRTDPARFWRTLIIAVVVALVIGVCGGWVVNKAGATETVVSRMCVTASGEACPTPSAHDRKFARLYREGFIRHSHGFDPHVIFAHPVEARRLIVNRISHALARQARAAGSTQRRCDQCLAWQMYGDMVASSGCNATGSPDFSRQDCRQLYGLGNTRPFNMHDLQVGLTVGLCGSAVIIGIATSTATAGTTAIIASNAAASCIVGVWTMVDSR